MLSGGVVVVEVVMVVAVVGPPADEPSCLKSSDLKGQVVVKESCFRMMASTRLAAGQEGKLLGT